MSTLMKAQEPSLDSYGPFHLFLDTTEAKSIKIPGYLHLNQTVDDIYFCDAPLQIM